jgi:hypothetical protein
MRREHRRGIALALLLTGFAIAPAEAQETAAERLRKLEQRLEQMQRENDALRAEIEALKQELAPAETAPAETATAETAAEDLTQIEVAETPATPQGETPPVTTDLPADVVQNQPNPGAGKVFNPDISVIGTFVAKAGDRNEYEERPAAELEEAEIAFQAFVDPYAQAKFFVGVGPEGAELEEGFISFITLPHDFTARVGKMKASFGKANLMHTHVRKWVDQPLVIKNFFGDEGLNDSGVSVSRIFPNRANVFVEGTAEVFSGNVEDVFEADNLNDLFYLGHLKAYRDLTERSNLEIGTSYARGTAPENGGTSEFVGLDLSYRYKPLERAIYRSFIGRAELISSRRDDTDDRAFGFYASGDYQFARRWFAGVRLDHADRADDPNISDRGASVTLTFWPSEFSQIRGQARRIRYGDGSTVNELLLQLQFSIGAHGAHTF